jgi:hypothetical protein
VAEYTFMLLIVRGNESGRGVINRVVGSESGFWILRMRSVNILSVWLIRPWKVGGLRSRMGFYDGVSENGKLIFLKVMTSI